MALFLSSFFLEKNEAKKASFLSNRSAFKGVRNDKAHYCVINKGIRMRVDKWLSAVNVVKRRTIATDMLKSGVVLINGMKAKASKDVKIGDKITIEYLKGAKHYEVLQIPKTKTIPKSQKEEFVKEL